MSAPAPARGGGTEALASAQGSALPAQIGCDGSYTLERRGPGDGTSAGPSRLAGGCLYKDWPCPSPLTGGVVEFPGGSLYIGGPARLATASSCTGANRCWAGGGFGRNAIGGALTGSPCGPTWPYLFHVAPLPRPDGCPNAGSAAALAGGWPGVFDDTIEVSVGGATYTGGGNFAFDRVAGAQSAGLAIIGPISRVHTGVRGTVS